MGLLQRCARSRLLWCCALLLLLVQVVHPGVPLTPWLWRSFGTRSDTLQPDSVRGWRTAAGDLELRCRAERTTRWLCSTVRTVDLEARVERDRLLARPNLYRIDEPSRLPDPGLVRMPLEGLPLVLAGGWVYPGFECLVWGPELYWTSALTPAGEGLTGHRMSLPLGGTQDLAGALSARLALSVPVLVFDVLAAPRLAGQTLLYMFMFSRLGGH